MTGAPTYEFKIGTSKAGMVSLHELTTPVTWPKDEYQRWPEVKNLVSGGQRGMGLPEATWYWEFAPGAQYTQLQVFQGSGANLTTTGVYIRTRNQNNQFKDYQCDMLWPANIQWTAGRVVKFEIKFRNLVEV